MEGTVSSVPNLYLLEAGIEATTDVNETREVLNYVRALERAIESLQDLPICSRLVRQAHRDLLADLPKSRGGIVPPGEFKRYQNFIGRIGDRIETARFVQCPPAHVDDLMADLDSFINFERSQGLSPLFVAALAHYQFETIHPFPDGNGRVGRLLIPLILMARRRLVQPLLYLSPYIEANKDCYIDRLHEVSTASDWLGWLAFFLEAVCASCNEAIGIIDRLETLNRHYRLTVQQARSSALLTKLVDAVFETPVLTVPKAEQILGITYRAARTNIDKLIEAGLLQEMPIINYPKTFIAGEIIAVLNDGHPAPPTASGMRADDGTLTDEQPDLPF
jgi:Fic family protein